MARYIKQKTVWDVTQGIVLSGATVTIYLAGTLTLATAYADDTTGTPLASSQTATDANGFYKFYVDDGDYNSNQEFKIVISKSGFTPQTFDDIRLFPFASTGYADTIKAADIITKAPYIDIRAYGAVGDGVADDTAVFTTVEALAGAKDIYLPDGTYVVDLQVLKKNYFGPGIIKMNSTDRPQVMNPNNKSIVQVFPSFGGWHSNVLLPNGTWLDTTGTTTVGLQEAIDYAIDNFYDCHINGGNSGNFQMIYTCTTTLTIKESYQFSLTADQCRIDFPVGIGANSGWLFESADLVRVDLSKVQTLYSGTGAIVEFKPTELIPVDGVIMLVASTYKLPTLVAMGTSTTVNSVVCFDAGAGYIDGCQFELTEINTKAETNPATYGILVKDPGATKAFTHNKITAPFNHEGVGTVQVLVGESSSAANLIYGNEWNLFMQVNAGDRALETWGEDDIYNLVLRNPSLSDQAVEWFRFKSTSETNLISVPHIPACSAATVYGVSTDTPPSGISATNKIISAQRRTYASITPGASAYTYTNVDCVDETVFVQGGTVSDISGSVDGSNYYNTGATAGGFKLAPGDNLRVTYSSAPTMFKFY